MNIKNSNAAPTQEESIRYFQNLPALENVGAPVYIAGASTQVDHAESLPAALALSSAPQADADAKSLAEIGKDEALVIAFADGVSVENRKAVMLSMKFAETVARAKEKDNTGGIQWLKDYTEAMSYSGWGTVGGLSFSNFTTRDVSVTMDAVVVDLISAIAGPNKLAVLQLMSVVLDKMQKSGPLMKLFEHNSQKGSTVRFRIMPCLESPQGIPVTYLLAVEVDFSNYKGGALFWKWTVSSLDIRQMTSGVNFDIEAFNRSQQQILDYLKGNSDDYFASLPRA